MIESRNVTDDWWGRVERVHGEIVTQWVHCKTKRQPFALQPGHLSVLLQCGSAPELESLDVDGAHRGTALARMREQLTWALCKIDQFKVLSVAEQQSVDRLPRQWVSVLRRCRATPLTAHSLDDIQSATHEYLQSIESLCSDPFRPQPVSEEYSAEVQLRVLHLTLDEIAEPVLDIGCGKDALLVHWLRCQQLNAIGIDLCGNPSRGGVAADWFEFPFVPAYFGTIIAHLSFSLQFLRHHLDPKGDAQRFAKQYMNILRSLKVGGRLVYTPGLPFLEQHLPRSNYSVTRYPIEDLPQDSQGAELYARQLGDDPLYACHVRRQ